MLIFQKSIPLIFRNCLNKTRFAHILPQLTRTGSLSSFNASSISMYPTILSEDVDVLLWNKSEFAWNFSQKILLVPVPELIRIHQQCLVYHAAYQLTPLQALGDCATHGYLEILKVELLEFLAGTSNMLVADSTIQYQPYMLDIPCFVVSSPSPLYAADSPWAFLSHPSRSPRYYCICKNTSYKNLI